MEIWYYMTEIKLLVHIGVIREHTRDWHFEVIDASRVSQHILAEIEKIKY